MYNDTITEHDLLESVRLVAQEILDYNPDATDATDVMDAIHEQADGLVNVYYYACAQEWLAVGMPEVPEEFHGEATTDVNRLISLAMYNWYEGELVCAVEELLEERNEVDETQAEIDAYLDTPTREDEVTA